MKLLQITTAVILATTASYASADNFLQKLNNTLGTVNQVLGAMNGQSASSSSVTNSASPMGQATEHQLQKIIDAQNIDTNNVQINKAILEARDSIDKLLLAGACYSGHSLPIGEILSANYRQGYVTSAMSSGFANYHPKNQCMSVSSITNWSMPANNALEFRVLYISDVSGEAVKKNVELMRMEDGW